VEKMRVVDLVAMGASLIFLLGVAPPAFYQSREIVRRAKCASNLKRIGDAIRRYLNDNKGGWFASEKHVQYHRIKLLPPGKKDLLWPDYVDDLEVFICPSNTKNYPSPMGEYYYEYNYRLRDHVYDDVLYPAITPCVHDTDGYGRNARMDPEDNHGDEGGHILFCDFHVKWIHNTEKKQEWYEAIGGTNPTYNFPMRSR